MTKTSWIRHRKTAATRSQKLYFRVTDFLAEKRDEKRSKVYNKYVPQHHQGSRQDPFKSTGEAIQTIFPRSYILFLYVREVRIGHQPSRR